MQNLSGLDLDFAERLARLRAAAQEAGLDLDVTSGYRTPERQAELYQQALNKYGSEQAARKWVAPPGRSQHNLGSAADLSYASPDARAWAHENAPAHGLSFPLGNEPWHIEPVGARSGPRPAPVAAATQAAPAPRANRFLAALEDPAAPVQAEPMAQAAQPERRPNRFLAALDVTAPTQVPAQPAAAPLPDLLGNAQAAPVPVAQPAPVQTRAPIPEFRSGGRVFRQAQPAAEKPGFWGSIGPAFRGHASLSQNLGEAAGLGEAPRGIDPKTGRMVGAPQGLAEQAGQFVGVAGKELVDPISLALAPVGAGMATVPRLAIYAVLGGGYEAASSALEQAMGKGTIDPGAMGQRALIGAVAAPALDVVIRGAATAIRKLRGLPAQDAARRTVEINSTVRQAAEQQGVDPAAAQSELVRLVTDETSGRTLIEPDAQAPARLAGFLPETPDAQAPRLPSPEGQAAVAPAGGGEPGVPSPGPEIRPTGAELAPGPAPLEPGGPGRGTAPGAPETLPGQGGQVAPQETLTPTPPVAARSAPPTGTKKDARPAGELTNREFLSEVRYIDTKDGPLPWRMQFRGQPLAGPDGAMSFETAAAANSAAWARHAELVEQAQRSRAAAGLPYEQGSIRLGDAVEGDINPVVVAQAKYDEAKGLLDALGPEPIKPSGEAKQFGTRGRAAANPDVVAAYDARVKAYNSWKRKYSALKKAEVAASNDLFYAKQSDIAPSVAAAAPEPAAGPGPAAAGAPAEPGQAGLGGAVGGEVGAEPELPGIAPRNRTQQDLSDLVRSREAARGEVPGPEGFRLAGSDREADQAAAAGQTSLFSNPFTMAGRAMVRGAAQAPGHALAGGFAGGVGGATTSTEPVGTPGWWRDVGMGAAGGAALGVGLRGAGVTGKGGVLADWYGKLGRAVDQWRFVGRGPDEVIQAKRDQRLMETLLDEQVGKVGVFLRDRFTPAERGQMADLIEGKGIVRDFDAIHRQAQALDTYLKDVGRQMQDLGMLGPDVDVDGGYLHRYYSKHLLDDLKAKTPEQQARRQARSQQGLSGSYTIRRGTTDAFERDYLSPAARAHVEAYEADAQALAQVEKEIAKAQRSIAREQARGPDPEMQEMAYESRVAPLEARADGLRAQMADARKVKLTSFTGTQNGKPHEFIFATDEVGRVDAGQPPVLAYKDKPGPGLDPRAMPEAPGVEDLAPTGRAWTLDGIGKDGKPNLHRDWTKEERAAWGEIPDAGYRFVRGMAEASHDLSLARMFKTVASRADFVKAAADAPPEWIRVPDSQARPKSPLKRYGALSGMAVRPDVWNGIKNYGRAPFWDNPAGDLYRSTLARWKSFKTVYNPVTHLNNVGSNVHLYSMAGYHPKELAAAVGDLRRADSPLVREARNAGLFSGDWVSSLKDVDGQGKAALNNLAEALRTQPEIPDAVQVVGALTKAKEWWINSSNSLREAQGPLQTGAALGKALGDPVLGALKTVGKPVQRAADAMQRAYRFEDDLFKMAVYRAERAKGASPDQAVEVAQRYFFDYRDLPEAVKWVRDFPIGAPFVSYTWKALPAVVRTAVEHPELVLATVAGYEALNYAAIAAGEDEPGMGPGEYWETERAEQTVSAPWERGRSAFGARNTLHLPGLEDYTLAMARVYPLGNPFVMESSPKDKALGGSAVPGFWGPDIMGGNPITRLIVDLTEGKDWKGKDLWKPGTPPDEKVRIGLNYIYQAVTPSNPLFPGSYPQQKIIEGLAQDKAQAIEAGEQPNAVVSTLVDTANAVAEALGGEQFTGLDRSGKPVATGEAALQSLGVKVRQFDPEAGFDWEARRPKQAAQDIKAWRKSRGRLAGEGRITEEQLAADEAQAEARLEAGPQAQRARLEAARELLERQGRFSR